MSKRGTTFYENAELASTISISYKRRPRFTVQVGYGGVQRRRRFHLADPRNSGPADTAALTISTVRSGRARAGVDDRPDMLATQRGGEPARHESVHDLHVCEMARRCHHFHERTVERQ